jgi:KUP system potassium uptake protein
MTSSTDPAPVIPDPIPSEPTHPAETSPKPGAAPPWRLAIAALGIVFGDIGTSPLYAFRESFIGVHKLPIDRLHVLGVLSLIVWALILVVTVKYVLITMRADNDGEGGSFALLALIRRRAPGARVLPAISVAALMATALFYGDAVITPAISILSAVEGVTLADPKFAVAVLPVTVAITLVLFAVQYRGTGVVGRFFGPVMLVWFVTIGGLGVLNILIRPEVIAAVSPQYAFALLAEDPLRAFLTLGTVVLTITGAEALYADMGHFGRIPISTAWMAVVLPCLLLCYAGQAALVLHTPAAIDQAFYMLAPNWALWPLLALATAATVIASQSAITGAFSVTAQAIQLNYLPRLKILHTSADARGQLFVPAVNAIICITVIGLVLAFRSSDALAAAFGFAVTSTMVLTTLMMGFVLFRIWRVRLIWGVPVYAVVLTFDLALFASSATKIPDGAWLPLLIAATMMLIFTTWARGRDAMAASMARDQMPVEQFLRENSGLPRVPGLAVYLSRQPGTVPHALRQIVLHSHVLHECVLLATTETDYAPFVPSDKRLQFEEIAPGMARAVLTFGFFDDPNVPAVLRHLPDGWRHEMDATSFIVGRLVAIPGGAHPPMSRWRCVMFRLMLRLAGSVGEYFSLPPGRVIEIGVEVEI